LRVAIVSVAYLCEVVVDRLLGHADAVVGHAPPLPKGTFNFWIASTKVKVAGFILRPRAMVEVAVRVV
jgi:hypothetical protein